MLGIVDLANRSFETPPESPDDVAAALWNCDGSDVAVLGSGRTMTSLNRAFPSVVLPDQTFLFGSGAC